MTNKLHRKIMSMYGGRYTTKNYYYYTDGYMHKVFRRRKGSPWDCADDVFVQDDNGKWHMEK